MGLDNINQNNDSITSRDGYGYNIYLSNKSGAYHVMRDVWGEKNDASYIDTSNNYSYNQGLSKQLADAKAAYNTAYSTTFMGDDCAKGGEDADARTCQGYVLALAEAYKEFHRCAAVNAGVCDSSSPTTECHKTAAHPCYADKVRLTAVAALVLNHNGTSTTTGTYSGCLSDAAKGVATG